MRKLKVVRKFDAAHFVKGYDGKCANLHGHTWKVVFVFRYPDEVPEIGIIEDFSKLKRQLDGILPDHKNLNDVFSFNPTAENLCKVFYELEKLVNPAIESVEVWESEDACAEYSES